MCIEAMSKSVAFFSVYGVFYIIQMSTVETLKDKLKYMCAYQEVIDKCDAYPVATSSNA